MCNRPAGMTMRLRAFWTGGARWSSPASAEARVPGVSTRLEEHPMDDPAHPRRGAGQRARRSRSRRRARILRPLVFVGVLLLTVAAILALKPESRSAAGSPVARETDLDVALSSGRPVVVFLHSLDCVPCRQMMNVVAEVHPEFEKSVTLLDVDVYNQGNYPILRREKLQAIPTLVFYDRQGTRSVSIGVISADELRVRLKTLAEGAG